MGSISETWEKEHQETIYDVRRKVDRLESALAAMTRRAECAEADMQMAGWGNNCEVCAYFDEPDENAHCNACDGDPGHSGFKWRGPKEDA